MASIYNKVVLPLFIIAYLFLMYGICTYKGEQTRFLKGLRETKEVILTEKITLYQRQLPFNTCSANFDHLFDNDQCNVVDDLHYVFNYETGFYIPIINTTVILEQIEHLCKVNDHRSIQELNIKGSLATIYYNINDYEPLVTVHHDWRNPKQTISHLPLRVNIERHIIESKNAMVTINVIALLVVVISIAVNAI